MNLFTLSDTHGHRWPNESVDHDWILFAGDLVDGASADELGDFEDASELDWTRMLAGLPANIDCSKVIAVRGNHDVADPLRFFASATDISDGRLLSIAPKLWVGGIGWHGEKYFDLPTESDLLNITATLARAVRRQVMPGQRWILISHYPPLVPGVLPDQPAFGTYACVAALIQELRPCTVICGHLHEWFGLNVQWQHPSGPATSIVFPGPGGTTLQLD